MNKIIKELSNVWQSEFSRTILRSLAYFAEDRSAIVLVFIFTVLSTLIGVLQAWPLAVMIDSLFAPSAEQNSLERLFLALLPPTPIAQIVGLAGIALALRLTQEIVATAQKLLHARINYRGLLRVRCDLFRKMQALHLGYHRSEPIGHAIYRVSADTFGCQMVLGVLISISLAVITLIFILGILISRSLALTSIALMAVPLLIWANLRFGGRIQRRTIKAKEADSAFTSSVHRSVAAMELIQAFGREEDECSRFVKHAQTCVRHWFDIHKQEVGYSLCIGAILGVDGALILGYGGHLVHQQNLTPGELMVFISYLGMLYGPLCQLTGVGISLQSGVAGAQRVFDVLDKDIVVSDAPGAISIPVRPRTLKLDNVCFYYVSGRPILKGISVTIPPGTCVAFVGASGVGKTTLLNLLLRFYDPTGGRIALDEHDLRAVKLKDLRKHVALVSQDSIILPTSIRENIAYGAPFASEAEIRKASQLAGASFFIEALPDSYETE